MLELLHTVCVSGDWRWGRNRLIVSIERLVCVFLKRVCEGLVKVLSGKRVFVTMLI